MRLLLTGRYTVVVICEELTSLAIRVWEAWAWTIQKLEAPKWRTASMKFS
jgi:hypothetical protein